MNATALAEQPHPLQWTMTLPRGADGKEQEQLFEFDLLPLASGYSQSLLLALKEELVKRRTRVSLSSVASEYNHIKGLLLKCQFIGLMDGVVERIDLTFLAALKARRKELTASGLEALKRLFNSCRANHSIFAADLRPQDIPRSETADGQEGQAIKRLLSQALTRAALSQTLNIVEEAYETAQIDIGHYSFMMLALQVYFRPASYRQIRLMDLGSDEDKSTKVVRWFVEMLPAKTRAEHPDRLSIEITQDVGELLKLQQEHVVQKYGHLVSNDDVGKLALFPARKLKADGTWQSSYANQNYGMCSNSSAFARAYLRPIEQLTGRNLTFNALRHTVGTQLALAGLSASSIAAVLRHATDTTCQRYVDLFFRGVLDRISDAMQPAFDEHFPAHKELMDRVISKHDGIKREKAIVSEDPDTGRREVTAECGRESLCGYAPLACYDCKRFHPCWDADHTINLAVVTREIADFEGQGLAMQHEVKKYKQLRNSIRIVINICALKSNAANPEHYR